MASAACMETFGTTELLENILKSLSHSDLASARLVCHHFNNTVRGSSPLQETLFLPPVSCRRFGAYIANLIRERPILQYPPKPDDGSINLRVLLQIQPWNVQEFKYTNAAMPILSLRTIHREDILTLEAHLPTQFLDKAIAAPIVMAELKVQWTVWLTDRATTETCDRKYDRVEVSMKVKPSSVRNWLRVIRALVEATPEEIEREVYRTMEFGSSAKAKKAKRDFPPQVQGLLMGDAEYDFHQVRGFRDLLKTTR